MICRTLQGGVRKTHRQHLHSSCQLRAGFLKCKGPALPLFVQVSKLNTTLHTGERWGESKKQSMAEEAQRRRREGERETKEPVELTLLCYPAPPRCSLIPLPSSARAPRLKAPGRVSPRAQGARPAALTPPGALVRRPLPPSVCWSSVTMGTAPRPSSAPSPQLRGRGVPRLCTCPGFLFPACLLAERETFGPSLSDWPGRCFFFFFSHCLCQVEVAAPWVAFLRTSAFPEPRVSRIARPRAESAGGC